MHQRRRAGTLLVGDGESWLAPVMMVNIERGRTWAVDDDVPQRYPFSAVSCTALSTRCGEDSCVGGRAIRTCHFGNGRLCCRHGRRAYPDGKTYVSDVSSHYLIHPIFHISCLDHKFSATILRFDCSVFYVFRSSLTPKLFSHPPLHSGIGVRGHTFPG